MLIEGNVSGKVYKDLISYALKNCDVIFVERYHDQHSETTKKMINFFKESGLSEDYLYNNYSEELLENLYQKYKNNDIIFNKAYKKRWEPENDPETTNSLKWLNRRSRITTPIKRLYRNRVIDNWLNKYKSNIISQKEIYSDISLYGTADFHYSTIYFLKITKELEHEILNRPDLYDSWCFPNSIENITFFKGEYCWLYSVSHEDLCEIYVKDEEEYNYLKSIGIKFFEDIYTPTPKERSYFENYL